MSAVIAEDEVVARRNAWPAAARVAAQGRIDVGLYEPVATDVDGAVALRHELAGKSDDALDERRAAVTPSASLGFLGRKTTICPRFGSSNLYASRLAITRSLNRPWQKAVGCAQWSVGSIEGEGMRYGLATSA